MIPASDTVEFVPHGRKVLENHPGPSHVKPPNETLSENSLLYKFTNVEIKDDSFIQMKKEADKEQWSVKEFFYNPDSFFEEEPPPPPPTKDKGSSTSNRYTRVKKLNLSFKTDGKKFEGPRVAGPSRGGSADSSSNMSKKFGLNNSKNKSPTRNCPPKLTTDCWYEEELYVKGCTAVRSRGALSGSASTNFSLQNRETVASYTMISPIEHAIFCNFQSANNKVMFIDALNTQIQGSKNYIKIEDSFERAQTKVVPSILLINQKSLTVYTNDGTEHTSHIPFIVKNVWNMKYGVLFEKEPTKTTQNTLMKMSFIKPSTLCNSSYKSKTFNTSARSRHSMSTFESDVALPTCFSLAHPLDEILPVIINSVFQDVQYFTNGDQQIIFVCCEPSIVLLYDWVTGVHSLYQVRRATREEVFKLVPNLDMTATAPMTHSFDFGSGTGSKMKNTTAGSSKKNKRPPMSAGKSAQGRGLLPSRQQNTSSIIIESPTPPSYPLYPEICFDHIWTQEPQTTSRELIEAPSENKAFLHKDFVGDNYLCFFVKSNGVCKLQIARLKESHSSGRTSKTNMIVGSLSTLPAKDAVVLNHLNIFAVLEDSGNIVLYSGTTTVGKLYVGSVSGWWHLASMINSPATRPSPAFQSAFPRRSSLLPSSRVSEGSMDDSALVLSPVPHTKPAQGALLGIRGLRDPVYNRLTIVCDKGLMYRITLPAVATSPLVSRCITALQAVVPKDIAKQVITKWYGQRNCPGSRTFSPFQEWTVFSNLLITLLGYNPERLASDLESGDEEVAAKRQRTSNDGSSEDWNYLLNSRVHKLLSETLSGTFNLTRAPSSYLLPPRPGPKRLHVDFKTNAILFPYTMNILFSFHLLYEDLKLSMKSMSDLEPLSILLFHLAREMRMVEYTGVYWKDFPNVHLFEYENTDLQVSNANLAKLNKPPYFNERPPQIFSYLNAMWHNLSLEHYPYLPEVNCRTKNVIEIITEVVHNQWAGVRTINVKDNVSASSTPRDTLNNSPRVKESDDCKAVKKMFERDFTQSDIDDLPSALCLFFKAVCRRVRKDPPLVWQAECYELIGRPELAAQANLTNPKPNIPPAVLNRGKETPYTPRKLIDHIHLLPRLVDEPGFLARIYMEHLDTKLLRLRHPEDQRAVEAFRLLQSSIPVNICEIHGELTEHNYIEKQEEVLFCLSSRTTALPVGRGMLNYRTFTCLPTESLSVPKLVVSGRGLPPRHLNIELTTGTKEVSANYLLWPNFHNGVAAGLSLVSAVDKYIDFSWVTFNRPKGPGELVEEHAGMLLALGLNGHLKDIPNIEIYNYLLMTQEMISAAVLLGLSATYKGTMNNQVLKLLSIHLELLLPPTSIEMNIPQIPVAAALMGLGLLFEGSCHTHFTHVMLMEIGKPPSSETQNTVDREGYALAAGLALGHICLGQGDDLPHHVTSALRIYMLGVEKPTFKGTLTESKKAPNINLDVTSPGATVAIGLIFQRTHNRVVASWLDPPDTSYLIEAVRPDLLLLRMCAKGLVLWDEIEPTVEWVEKQVPILIRENGLIKPRLDHIDYDAMSQAYCNIVGGACFAMGLRFAGSADIDARDVLLNYVKKLYEIVGRTISVLVGKSTIETCICICLISAGMVMAGTGDLEVLKWCKFLRDCVQTPIRKPYTLALTYGGQMAVHAALGLLFIGGGRFTLGSSRSAVAALMTAFFPKFPVHSEDNRYHLQAFRHLYVFAIEARLVIPRDFDTGVMCYANLRVIDIEGNQYMMRAPCFLPELNRLQEVRVSDDRHWPIVFQRDRNWDQLKALLDNNWCMDIKQRPDFPMYAVDEHGRIIILGQSLIGDKSNVWAFDANNLDEFTNDKRIKNFVKQLLDDILPRNLTFKICQDCYMRLSRRSRCKSRKECVCRTPDKEDVDFIHMMNVASYFCIVKDTWCALPVWVSYLEILRTLKTNPGSYNIWQMKLLKAQMEHYYSRLRDSDDTGNAQTPEALSSTDQLLIPVEFITAFMQKVSTAFDEMEDLLTLLFKRYLGLNSRRINHCEALTKKMLSAYTTYYETPKYLLINKNLVMTTEVSMAESLQQRYKLTEDAMEKIEPFI